MLSCIPDSGDVGFCFYHIYILPLSAQAGSLEQIAIRELFYKQEEQDRLDGVPGAGESLVAFQRPEKRLGKPGAGGECITVTISACNRSSINGTIKLEFQCIF